MENKNKIKIVFAVACTSSSSDQQSNNVSLFSVIEEVRFDGKILEGKRDNSKEITVPYQFDIVALFSRTNTSDTGITLPLDGKVYLISPEGRTLIDNPIKALIEKGKKRFRMTIKFNGIPVTKSGTYIFKIVIFETGDVSHVVEIPIDFTINLS